MGNYNSESAGVVRDLWATRVGRIVSNVRQAGARL